MEDEDEEDMQEIGKRLHQNITHSLYLLSNSWASDAAIPHTG
jgi:hypothetical protein